MYTTCTRTTDTYVVRVLKSRLKKLKKVNGYTYTYTYSMAFFFLLRSQSFSEFLANQRRDRGEPINWSAWDEFGSFSGETDRLSLEWAPFTVQRSAPRPPCLIKNYSTVSIFVRKRCPYLARAYSIDNVCTCRSVDCNKQMILRVLHSTCTVHVQCVYLITKRLSSINPSGQNMWSKHVSCYSKLFYVYTTCTTLYVYVYANTSLGSQFYK